MFKAGVSRGEGDPSNWCCPSAPCTAKTAWYVAWTRTLRGPRAECMRAPCDRNAESVASLALEAWHPFPACLFRPSRPPPCATATHEAMSQFDSLRRYNNTHTSTSPGGTTSKTPDFVSWRCSKPISSFVPLPLSGISHRLRTTMVRGFL